MWRVKEMRRGDVFTYMLIALKCKVIFIKKNHKSGKRAQKLEKKLYLFLYSCKLMNGLPGGSAINNLLEMQETWVRSLGQEEPLVKRIATYSNILA